MVASPSITPLRVFLSYSSEQANIAEQVYFSLKTSGHDVFFDRTNLLPGEEYNRAILDRIRSSDLFVFLISPSSIEESAYTRTEMRFARDTWPNPAGRVLPVLAVPTDFSQIPNYLKAVTILHPDGNLPAEVSASVNDLAAGRTLQDTIAGKAGLIDQVVKVTEQLHRSVRVAEIDKQWDIDRKKLFGIDQSEKTEEMTWSATPAVIVFMTLLTLLLSYLGESFFLLFIGLLGTIFSILVRYNYNMEMRAYKAATRRYHDRRMDAQSGKYDKPPIVSKETGTIGMEEARIIRQRRAAGETREALAEEYQIQVSTVLYIEKTLDL
jgi:hypothetical protein